MRLFRPPGWKTNRELIEELLGKVDKLVTSIDELTQSFEQLKSDIEAKAAEAAAEFAKLEEEVAAGGTSPNLEPLGNAINDLDAAVKAASVPTT